MRSEEEIRQAYEAIAYFGFGSKYPPDVKPDEKAVIVARTLKWVLEGCNKKDSDSEQEQESGFDWWQIFLWVLCYLGTVCIFSLLTTAFLKACLNC